MKPVRRNVYWKSHQKVSRKSEYKKILQIKMAKAKTTHLGLIFESIIYKPGLNLTQEIQQLILKQILGQSVLRRLLFIEETGELQKAERMLHSKNST